MENMENMATYEKIYQPLYDTVKYNGELELIFFQVPIGVGGKTLRDTNLFYDGHLPESQSFVCSGLAIDTDDDQLLRYGYVELQVGSKIYFKCGPASQLLRYRERMMYLKGSPEVTENQNNYIAYRFEISLFLAGEQNFSATLYFPEEVPTHFKPCEIRFELCGVLYRPAI